EIYLNCFFASLHTFSVRCNITNCHGFHFFCAIDGNDGFTDMDRHAPHFHAAFRIKVNSDVSHPSRFCKFTSETKEGRRSQMGNAHQAIHDLFRITGVCCNCVGSRKSHAVKFNTCQLQFACNSRGQHVYPRDIPLFPTRTRCTFVMTCAAPIDITPGSVQPGIGAGVSAAPVAIRSFFVSRTPSFVCTAKPLSVFSMWWAETPHLTSVFIASALSIKAFVSFIPFHHSPLGSWWSCPSNLPPGFGNSSMTSTCKSDSLHAIAADNPAGPAPMISTSYMRISLL